MYWFFIKTKLTISYACIKAVGNKEPVSMRNDKDC